MTELRIKNIEETTARHLHKLSEDSGLPVEEEARKLLNKAIDLTIDSATLVREDRDWLDQRDEKRAAETGGLREDFSHLKHLGVE